MRLEFFEDPSLAAQLVLEEVVKLYELYSQLENDSVANAICWCCDTLINLQNKRPVRTMDEVLSFATRLLRER